MNRFDIDFDGLRAQGLEATLLNARPSRYVGKHSGDQSMITHLTRALRTISGLWNRHQHLLPDPVARSRDRMVDAVRL